MALNSVTVFYRSAAGCNRHMLRLGKYHHQFELAALSILWQHFLYR